jgi:hypothetical protein
MKTNMRHMRLFLKVLVQNYIGILEALEKNIIEKLLT